MDFNQKPSCCRFFYYYLVLNSFSECTILMHRFLVETGPTHPVKADQTAIHRQPGSASRQLYCDLTLDT